MAYSYVPPIPLCGSCLDGREPVRNLAVAPAVSSNLQNLQTDASKRTSFSFRFVSAAPLDDRAGPVGSSTVARV